MKQWCALYVFLYSYGLSQYCLSPYPDSDSDSDNVYSTKMDTDTKSGLQKNITIYNNHITSYIMNLMHVGRPQLRSYLTAGMGATRRGIACTRSERIHNATFWRSRMIPGDIAMIFTQMKNIMFAAFFRIKNRKRHPTCTISPILVYSAIWIPF